MQVMPRHCHMTGTSQLARDFVLLSQLSEIGHISTKKHCLEDSSVLPWLDLLSTHGACCGHSRAVMGLRAIVTWLGQVLLPCHRKPCGQGQGPRGGIRLHEAPGGPCFCFCLHQCLAGDLDPSLRGLLSLVIFT